MEPEELAIVEQHLEVMGQAASSVQTDSQVVAAIRSDITERVVGLRVPGTAIRGGRGAGRPGRDVVIINGRSKRIHAQQGRVRALTRLTATLKIICGHLKFRNSQGQADTSQLMVADTLSQQAR